MSALWRWVSMRHLFQEGGRTLLTLLGVALGVAVFVSIRLANHSALASFSDTVDAVAGKANLQVTSDSGGFDERVYPELLKVPGVHAAAPAVQVYALARLGGPADRTIYTKGEEGAYSETLLVLGVDPYAEGPFARYEPPSETDLSSTMGLLLDPAACAVTRTLAERHGLEVGDPLEMVASGRPVTFTVRHIVDSEALQQALGGNVVLTHLGVAQGVFRRPGKLDRVDLIVDPDRRDEVAAAIRPLLPANARVARPEARTQQVDNMVRAFELNLTALSFIALFVSTFLIFNAVSMAVLRRRREIGILRSLGVTRRQVLLQFLREALFLGVVGSLVGLLLGTLLARGALGSVTRTLTALYLILRAQNLDLDPWLYLQGFGIGVGMSLLSALAPAIEASLTPPSVTMRQGLLIEAQPVPIRGLTTVGLSLLAGAAAVSYWTVREHQPLGGFVSAFLLLLGFSLVAPAFTLLSQRLLDPAARRIAGVEGALGSAYLRAAVARTSVVVAALMVSVGMTIGLSVMVGSFRKTVQTWVNQTMRGDLYIEPVGRRVTGGATNIDSELIETARRLPGVAAVDTYRALQIEYGEKIAHLVAVDFDVQSEHGRFQLVRGDSSEVFARALREGGVLVTESFQHRHGVGQGDRVRLGTPSGVVELPVTGVFYDYSTDAGAVLMDYRLYWRLWNTRRTESFALYVEPGASVDQVREAFLRTLRGDLVLHVTPNQALRERIITVFDQTFQITYALQTICIVVAVLGVISTLTALILQRGREIGVLRAVGALRRQVQEMVLVESGLMGLIGSLLGCFCGIALAYLLTYVINKQFFGWSIRMSIDPWLFVQAVLLMVATALIAGLVPARLAASRLAAEAMRVE